PDFTDAFINLGATLKELDRLDEAESNFRQAIVLKPDSIMAYNKLGLMLQQINRLDEAEISLRQALKIKPDDTAANAGLGLLLANLGQHRESLEYLRIGCGSIVFDTKNGLSIE
ncbi:MAG: tetratricopeptide repeat protein, partial [Gammaproteobacteria bacterium]